LVETDQTASEAFNPYESYPQLLVNLLVEEKRPFEEIEGLDTLKAKVEAEGMRHLFRYSGTENKIRLLLEGKDEQKLELMMEECKTFFKGALV
jgi:phosphoglucosamine mutase